MVGLIIFRHARLPPDMWIALYLRVVVVLLLMKVFRYNMVPGLCGPLQSVVMSDFKLFNEGKTCLW